MRRACGQARRVGALSTPEAIGTFIDGPFTQTKELVAGYTIIKAKSRQEAIEWTKRFPNPGNEDGEIEVRQMFELEDFGPSEAIERFRELGVATEK